MQCFKWLNNYNDLQDYFKHVKQDHNIGRKESYKCTLCTEILKDFGRFKKHVETCFSKNNLQNEEEQFRQAEFLEAYNEAELEDQDITTFKDTMKKSALQLVSKMSANMITPRSLVFETILQFQGFMNTIINGMNTIILPRVKTSEKCTVKDFIKAVESSFETVNNEHKFDKELTKADLTQDFQKCALFQDGNSNEGEGCGMILMPIAFQIKTFFELPNVFQKIQKNTIEIQQRNKLSNFISGSLWKEKLQHYKEDNFVIPYHFYVDAAQLNHPLGAHCIKGAEEFNYYSFPTIPTEYQSRLQNIFVASLFPEKYIKTYNMEDIYGNIVEELTKFSHEGLVLNINGLDTKVFFVCGLFTGDNKESNTVLCFVRGFNANYYCRFCRLHKDEMKDATVENPEFRRNRQNYDDDVIIHDQSKTGVREYAVLNYIPHFHVTDSSSEDLTHNVDEGICHYNFSKILHYFIYDQEYFTLEVLNQRIRSFPYGDDEKSNVPQPILAKHFNKRKFKMTAAEMSTFTHNITFMIGDLVPQGDVVWHFLLSTVTFYDMCYLPSYEEEEIEEWRTVIDDMLNFYKYLFEESLKPVHHMAIHYPDDTKRYGPLRYTRTIRFEGKHKEIKGYSNNTNNRINISYSLAKKIQYNFANRLLESRGLEDVIEAKLNTDMVNEKVYWSMLESSPYKNEILQKECFFTQKITVNGMVFASGQWLPDFIENRRKVHEIFDIIVAAPKNIGDILAVCKTYNTITKNEHYCSYCVKKDSLQSELSLINIEDYLSQHQYPVKVHNIGGEFLFRCKRF